MIVLPTRLAPLYNKIHGMYIGRHSLNQKVDIVFCVHDACTEEPSSSTLKVKSLESQIV